LSHALNFRQFAVSSGEGGRGKPDLLVDRDGGVRHSPGMARKLRGDYTIAVDRMPPASRMKNDDGKFVSL
jgi:hypothetical protein